MSDYNNGQIWEMIWRLLHWIGMQEQEACMMENDYIKLEKERDALEAKLAKAVEIGNKMAHSIEGNYYLPNIAGEWRNVAAEIKGESHE